jgi:hypothetical protein
MSMSNYLEAKVLDHITGRAAFAAPSIYIGLSMADPGEDAAGLAEPTGGSYARVAHNGTAKWAAAANGAAATSAECTFPTATGDWGTITHMCIFDALTNGNLLWSGAFAQAKDVLNGDTARIGSGQLTLTLN